MSTTQRQAAVEATNHQQLFYALCEDLKALTRGKKWAFKTAVSTKALLEMECRYAEAETRMMREATTRILGNGAPAL